MAKAPQESSKKRDASVDKTRKDGDVIVIKKYANRRLYNTSTSSYVTLDHLCQMVKDKIDFVVYDAKTGEDITRPVLTQIIVEEESKGTNLLPITFLRQLISFYGDSTQWMVPRYLEHMMSALAKNQEQMRQSMQDTLGGMFPFGNLEEISKQNMALFESAMKMFQPDEEGQAPGAAGKSGGDAAKDEEQRLEELRQQIDALQKQIQALSKTKD